MKYTSTPRVMAISAFGTDIKRIVFIAVASAAALMSSISAKGAVVETSDSVAVQTPINVNTAAETEFHKMTFKGFSFEVPVDCTASGSPMLTIKSADAHFGASVDIGDANGANKKRAASLCRDLSRTMKLKNTKVETVKINGMSGAVATGVMEGRNVTVGIFISGEKEIRTILMYDDNYAIWAQRFIKSLKKA